MENNESRANAQTELADTQEQSVDYEMEFKALKEKYESLNNDYIKKSNAYDKVSSENASWKHKYTETLDEAQKQRIANEERESYYKNIEREYNLGKISNGLSKSISDNEVANNIAGKMLDGDFAGATEMLNKYFENHDEVVSKRITEQLLKSNPTPPPTNANNAGSVSKRDFEKMSYKERAAFREKDPEGYKKLAE